MEIDSGSHLSTINTNQLNKIHNVSLLPTKKRAKGYGNQLIKFKGEVKVQVSFNDIKVTHTLLVVNDNHVSLLGRDLCSKLRINLSYPVTSDVSVNSVQCNILNKYSTYLSNDFKSNVNEKISFNINEDVRPIFCKARPVPVRLKELVKKELVELEENGTISKVFSSRWACPTVNVLKSNNEIRICGDYSLTVNKVMDTVQYPLTSIEEVLGTVADAKVFSKIDCQKAFLQLPLDDKSKEYTTINTCDGLYQYNYLPFGIASSPALFQSYISKVLSGVSGVIIYQDDLLILTPTFSEHSVVLDDVLKRLMQAGIKLNINKCSFYTDSVTYLGHVFTSQGVYPSPDKLRAIIEAPEPTDVKQIQSFLGLCTFYNRFIHNFSTILSPIYDLLKKNVKFVWGEEQQVAFRIIKNSFQTSNILRLYDPSLETALESDASSYGIGSVLMQKHPEGWLPVQFASRTLSAAERNYSQIEREALSVIFGCEKFRQYLLGSKFLIKNDHKPLLNIFSNKKSGIPNNCSARLKRWALRLSQFHFVFEYIKGTENVTSDFLSRLPLSDNECSSEPYELIFVVEVMNDTPITFKDISKYTNSDSNLCAVKEYIKFGFPHKIHPSLKELKSNAADLTIVKGCIMYRNRVFIPKLLRERVLNVFHEGHPGVCGMKSLVRALIWYPGIDSDVISLVKNCKTCQSVLAKPSQMSHKQWPKPEKKWSRIHIDHFFFEDKTFFICIDALTKYIECLIVKSTSSNETIEAMREIFSRNGIPDIVVSDNATSFTSQEFKDFLSNNSIIPINPPPYSPASNGQIERSVRVIKNLLKKNGSGSIRKRLSQSLLCYRNVPHSITKISPSMALNGRNYVTLREKINPCFVADVPNNFKPIHMYNIGDTVLALNLREGKKWLTGTIVKVLGDNVFEIHLHDFDVVWRRHTHQLLLLHSYNDKQCLPSFNNNNSQLPVTENNIPTDVVSIPNSVPLDLPNVCTSSDYNETDQCDIANDIIRRSTRNRKSIDRYVP